jgi:hypothetical protein
MGIHQADEEEEKRGIAGYTMEFGWGLLVDSSE